MPVLENNRLAYQINFKSNSNKIVLGPATSIEMEAFYEKGNWFDGVHPTKKGAVLFSRWFAERFLETKKSDNR
jgi:lysophospholipase L1-like esterase